MATLHRLIARNELVEIRVRLDGSEQPARWIYGFPEFAHWLEHELPRLDRGRLQAADPPLEQVDYFLHRWIVGETIRYGRWFNDLMPRKHEIWEMKTADTRIFGWMYRRLQFIAVFGDYADLYKRTANRPSKRHYDTAIQKVLSARSQLDLDPPKFATGTFDDLVSV